jgi:hypothetical protein
MEREPVSSAPESKHLPALDVDVSDAQSWFCYVAYRSVLSGRSRRTGEA